MSRATLSWISCYWLENAGSIEVKAGHEDVLWIGRLVDGVRPTFRLASWPRLGQKGRGVLFCRSKRFTKQVD